MRKVLLSAATLFMSMLFGVSAYAADIDKTDKVGTSKEAWNAAGGPVNIDGISMPEKYETTTATLGDVMWQTVEGLDNGTYTVELWANARYTPDRGFESAATDGQLECTFLFANNVEISIPVVYNAALNNNTSHVLEGVEVTDGTLKMGMTKKADGSNWHTIQIKALTLHASDDAALASAKAELQAAIDAAAAVSPATEALTAAIAAAQGVLEAATTPEEVLAAVAPLQAATTLAVNTNAVAGATVAAPVVTNFVVNGTFDSTTAPWKCTTGAQNQALASNQTGAFTGNFFENWNPSNYTGKIYQVIENIPNGLYELSICAFANVFDGTAQYVYANADKTYLVAGAPTAYTVRTTVTDNKIELGLEQTASVNNWMGIDNVSLKYFGEVSGDYALELYKSTKAAAEALLGEKMSPEAKAALEAALAAEVDETSEEALIAAEAALQEAITAANVSINLYASNKAAIDAMFALMNSTNVYTAEAFAAYSAKAEDFLAQYEAGTLTATVDNPAAIHGWHASVDYDDLLLSAFGVKDFDTDLYINTWSTEGETDGSEFKVPFFEYWTGDDQSLAATTKTATVTGLEAGKKYEVSAWIRTRAKNGVAAVDATGITLSVGAGDSVDVTEGAVVGGSQFAHAVYTAVGAADENGNLTINFNVAADNNVSWLSFKNIKYADYNPAKEEFMAAAMALASLTETMPSIWTIPAVSEKFMTVQEKAFGMVDTLDLVPVDTLVYYTAMMNETAAFAQAMDAEFNEWKALLFTCYDYQDNSTADEAAVAAFAAVVDVHMGYQYSMPATTVAELEALTAELDDARIAYALVATASEGFDFGLPTVDSPWVGAAVADGMSAYLYNASAKAFLGAGNSWGTQASFNDGIEWVVAGAEKLYTFSGTVSNGGEQHYFTGTYTDGAATQVTVKPVGKGIYTLQVGGAYVAYDGTNIVANVAEVSEACYWQFVTKEERQSKYAAASVLNPASATFEISGANFGRNDGANNAWIGGPALGGENTNFCAEKWNAGIVTVSQVVRNMPAGVYRLSVQGFYRMGDMGPAAEARTNGTEILHAKFFANGDSIPVMSVLDCAGMLEGVGNSGYTGYGLAPNSMGEASKFFSAGLYEHSFMFTLAEGVDTINLGVTKTGSVGNDWLIFDNFRLEYLGAKNDVDYLGNGTLTSVPEGNHYVFYTDAEGGNHFLYAAGDNNWTVLDKPVTVEFSAGNIAEDPYAGAASFMNSNGYYMSNAQNSDGSGAIKTEAVGGSNGQKKRTWESQVFYKNAAGKYAIRLTNAKGTSWGANCFVNIDPATLAVGSGQPTLGDALYLWEIADEDDPRFSTEALAALINEAEALQGKCSKVATEALAAAIAVAKEATAAQVQDAKAALEAAIADFKASVAEYSILAELINRANAMLVEDATECYDDLAEVVELAEIFYNDGVVEETTASDLQTAMNEYVAALDATYSVEGLVNGTFGDVTASIDGWTQVGGASKTGSHNKWLNVNDGFFEQWQNTLPDVEIYQEISGLPAGTYTFAAYVVACQQSNLDSYEVSGVSLYANDDAVAVHTINIDRNATNQALGAEFVMVTTTIADGETLKVGMKVASTDANWVVMDNAKLYNFNPNPVNPGIENIEAIENNAIYTITGKRVQGILEKGLYIVNGKKVLVK
ncbi:MAG: hypothetical protein J6C15_11470 [Bacteroidaceae bacterium]|nr:hypothetical protein [Bacteroidaceae bacterium]